MHNPIQPSTLFLHWYACLPLLQQWPTNCASSYSYTPPFAEIPTDTNTDITNNLHKSSITPQCVPQALPTPPIHPNLIAPTFSAMATAVNSIPNIPLFKSWPWPPHPPPCTCQRHHLRTFLCTSLVHPSRDVGRLMGSGKGDRHSFEACGGGFAGGPVGCRWGETVLRLKARQFLSVASAFVPQNMGLDRAGAITRSIERQYRR